MKIMRLGLTAGLVALVGGCTANSATGSAALSPVQNASYQSSPGTDSKVSDSGCPDGWIFRVQRSDIQATEIIEYHGGSGRLLCNMVTIINGVRQLQTGIAGIAFVDYDNKIEIATVFDELLSATKNDPSKIIDFEAKVNYRGQGNF